MSAPIDIARAIINNEKVVLCIGKKDIVLDSEFFTPIYNDDFIHTCSRHYYITGDIKQKTIRTRLSRFDGKVTMDLRWRNGVHLTVEEILDLMFSYNVRRFGKTKSANNVPK